MYTILISEEMNVELLAKRRVRKMLFRSTISISVAFSYSSIITICMFIIVGLKVVSLILLLLLLLLLLCLTLPPPPHLRRPPFGSSRFRQKSVRVQLHGGEQTSAPLGCESLVHLTDATLALTLVLLVDFAPKKNKEHKIHNRCPRILTCCSIVLYCHSSLYVWIVLYYIVVYHIMLYDIAIVIRIVVIRYICI